MVFMVLLRFFFVIKYLLVGASVMLWTGGSVSGSVRDVCMSHQSDWICYLNTNQSSCYKGKWYVRRFDLDTVENGHIYSPLRVLI